MIEHMLTTDDNPHNPWTDFDGWYAWDERAGYHTTSFLSRLIRTSDEASELDQHQAYEQAIQEAVEHNTLGIYRKITRDQKPIALRSADT